MALPCQNLNLNLYRVFYTVAKTKSFSESSRVLHISQPAISKHIQNLEYELDTLLFYRTNRGIELTPEAKNLLTYVEKATNFLMLGEKDLQESKELTKGKISLGMTSDISTYYMKDYIKKFMEEHPNIVIKIAETNIEKLVEMLQQHTLDLLIIPSLDKLPKELKELPLYKEKYCFVYNKEKMTNPDVHDLNELSEKNILLPVKTTDERKNIEEMFNRKGASVDPIMELENNEMMLTYVKEGLGIGYMLEKIVNNYPELEKIELIEELPFKAISLIYNDSTLTNSSKEFISLVSPKSNI